MNNAIYLIQGFSFHKRLLEAERFSGARRSVSAVVEEVVSKLMFSGVIFVDARSLTNASGNMQDRFGSSRLMFVEMNWRFGKPNCVTFVKRYEHRSDIIHYELTYDGSMWVGEYEGKAVGAGYVKCYITDVSANLFFPPSMER